MDVTEIIDEQEAREVLRALVQAPSVNPPGDTTAVVGVLSERLSEAGIEWRVLAAKPGIASLVARLPGRGAGKKLVLNGHVDVVPAGDAWTVEPFAAVEREGRLYGRGASDMKGGVAAMLLAVLALKRAGAAFAGEVLFTAVADEETGSRLGTRYLLEQGIGRGAAYAIVGEPTKLRVELGNRGVAWFEITVRGRAGHSGRPASGINAVHYAGRLVSAIANMRFTLRNDLFEVPTPSISVTMIQGGVKANIIPAQCKLTVDRRLLPGESGELARRQLEELIAGMPEAGVSTEIVAETAFEPYVLAPDEPVVQALSRAHERVVGGRPVLRAKGGGTDGSHLFHEGGVPTALYGPGDPFLAHAADEYVELAHVVQAARVYALAVLDLLAEGA